MTNKSHPSKPWLFLAIACLLLGGFVSLFLVISRSPLFSHLIIDPSFAKRSLVVHVTLTLTCWFFAFISTLFYLLPGKEIGNKRLRLSALGITTIIFGGLLPGAEPILSNYIPVVHHPIFLVGSSAFIFSIMLSFLDKRLLIKQSQLEKSSLLDSGSLLGIKTTVLSFTIAILILLYSIVVTPFTNDHVNYYEIIFWGSGHIFQMANISGLVTVWLLLIKKVTGRALLSKNSSLFVFALILIPVLCSPVLLTAGTNSEFYYSGFTFIMRWGTWPSIVMVFFYIIKLLTQLKTESLSLLRNSMAGSGIFSSVLLLAVGFYLGAKIDMSSTLIPAHYHATIGSVTSTYMAFTFVLLQHFGFKQASSLEKWQFRQPIVYALGQLLFSIGFAFAGAYGLGRKVYGNEQLLDKTEKIIGLSIMGIGGTVAFISGGIYFYLVYKAVRK